MRRLFALTVTLLIAACAAAQSSYKVLLGGQQLGTATMGVKRRASGSVVTTLTMNIAIGGDSLKVKGSYEHDRTGRPVRFETVISEPGKVSTETVVYGATQASITVSEGGKTKKRKVAIPKGNISDRSVLWFVSERPRAGATISFMDLDSDTLKWEKSTTTYVGLSPIPDSNIKGHYVKSTDGDEWFDDKGQTIRMEMKMDGQTVVLLRN